MINVMRKKTGDIVYCTTESGAQWKCKISFVGKNMVQLIAIELIRSEESRVWRIAFSVIKPQCCADLVDKCTQVGITDFYPIITSHTQHHLNEKRLASVAYASVKQSGSAIIPRIHPVAKDFKFDHTWAVMHPSGDTRDFQGVEGVIIGPEGGFTKKEIEKFVSDGARVCNLGKTILRSETAATVASAMMVLQNHDL